MCNAQATGREHVPPRCLFPESKDVQGMDYRKNLIKVPSCDIHNSKKSKDDEYLLAVLTTYYQNNAVSNKHNETKVLRALTHSHKLAVRMVENGGTFGVLAYFGVDSDRIFNVCEHIAKGLCFYNLNLKWHHPFQFLSPAFPPTQNTERFLAESRKFEEFISGQLEKKQCRFRGDNPDIFQYRLSTDQTSIFVIQLIFYGGVCVSGFSRNSKELRKT
jgi:hypothetical protein